MIRLHIDLDEKETRATLQSIQHLGAGVEKACAAAINSTLSVVRSLAIRLAQSAYTVRADDLRRKTDITRAKAGSLTGEFHLGGKHGIGLINFQANPKVPILPRKERPKEGASVKVLRGGSRKNPRKEGKKAFAARGASGNVHLFVRLSQGAGGLKALYGPHPLAALGREELQRSLDRRAAEELAQALRREADTLLGVIGKGGK